MALKAAVIGLGVGQEHLRAYKEAGCEIVGVVDWDMELRERVAAEYNCHSFAQYKPFQDVPDIKDADIVSVCTYDQTHYEIAKSLWEFGKHVIVEKPPCLRPDHLENLRAVVAAKPAQSFMCNLPLPYHFRELLDVDFGDIYMIETSYNWGRAHKLKEWRADCKEYSFVLGAGLHMLDLMVFLKEREIGYGAALATNATGFHSPDTYAAVFNFSDGALGNLTINCGYEGVHEHVVKVWGRKDHRIVSNREEVDKTAPIKDFVRRLENGETWDNTRLWHVMEACFSLEASARG